jgi:hypothetical protein
MNNPTLDLCCEPFRLVSLMSPLFLSSPTAHFVCYASFSLLPRRVLYVVSLFLFSHGAFCMLCLFLSSPTACFVCYVSFSLLPRCVLYVMPLSLFAHGAFICETMIINGSSRTKLDYCCDDDFINTVKLTCLTTI